MRLRVVHPDLAVSAAQGDAAVVVRPFQVEDAVHKGAVLGHNPGLLDAPAPAEAHPASVPLPLQPPPGAGSPAGDAPDPVRLPPADRTGVVPPNDRLGPRVEHHDLPELRPEREQVPVPGPLAELDVVGRGAFGARERSRAGQPQHQVRRAKRRPPMVVSVGRAAPTAWSGQGRRAGRARQWALAIGHWAGGGKRQRCHDSRRQADSASLPAEQDPVRGLSYVGRQDWEGIGTC